MMAILDQTNMNFREGGNMCSICEKDKSDGLHLYIGFICTECEKAIVQTDTSDPVYQEYVEKMRKNNISGIYT